MWLYSEIKSLGDIPRHYGKTLPTKVALADATGTVSFAELDAATNRVAALMAQLADAPLGRVAFLSKNTARFFEVLFGVNKAACTLVPLNWRLAAPELQAIMADASPFLLIVEREYEDLGRLIAQSSRPGCRVIVFDAAQRGGAELDQLLKHQDAVDRHLPVNPWSSAILMYTSGTTGQPKGVQLSHQGFLYLRLCEHLEPSFSYQASDIMLTVMPLFHAMGTGLSLQALYSGASVRVYSMPEPAALMQLIARDKPTLVPLAPTVIQMLLDHPHAAEADYSSVRIVVYAGSSIAPHLLRRALEAMKCDFIQFYGATETSTGVTFLRPEQHRKGDEKVLKSCGSPLPLIEIKVADSDCQELPDGEVGEFLIRSPSITTGYFNQPEATAAAFRDGWYRSGDAGYRDAQGFLYVVDRVKDMIITGGENVYSTEVENALIKIPGVQMCAVIGLPDEKWGERVVAAIQPSPGVTLSRDDILAQCRTQIAGYKVPKQIEFVQTFPMTPTGKIKKQELRRQFCPPAESHGNSVN